MMGEGEDVLGDRDEVMMRDGRWRRFAGAVICCVLGRKKWWVEEWVAGAEIMSLRRARNELTSCSNELA